MSPENNLLKRWFEIYAEPHVNIIHPKRRFVLFWKDCAVKTALLSSALVKGFMPMPTAADRGAGRAGNRTRRSVLSIALAKIPVNGVFSVCI
jgi:hypothetical protein